MPTDKLHFPFPRRLGHRSWQQSAALAVALLLGACAPAPVQEMSEARQAIEAARAAGAQQLARPQFEEANELLHSAQQLLNDRRFRDARRSASQARDVAIQARETAEAVSEE